MDSQFQPQPILADQLLQQCLDTLQVLAYFADCAWSPSVRSQQAFLQAYCRLRFGATAPSALQVMTSLTSLEIPNVEQSQKLVYRPILLRERTAAWLAGMQAISRALTHSRREIATVRPTDLYAEAEIRAIETSLDRLLAAAGREIVLDSLSVALLGERGSNRASIARRAAPSLARLRTLEERSQSAFIATWLAHNDESELAVIRSRFQAQLRQLDSLHASAVAGELEVPARYR